MPCMSRDCQAPIAAIDDTVGSPHPNCGNRPDRFFLFVIQCRRNARHVIRTWTGSVSPKSAPCEPHMDGFSIAGIRAM